MDFIREWFLFQVKKDDKWVTDFSSWKSWFSWIVILVGIILLFVAIRKYLDGRKYKERKAIVDQVPAYQKKGKEATYLDDVTGVINAIDRGKIPNKKTKGTDKQYLAPLIRITRTPGGRDMEPQITVEYSIMDERLVKVYGPADKATGEFPQQTYYDKLKVEALQKNTKISNYGALLGTFFHDVDQIKPYKDPIEMTGIRMEDDFNYLKLLIDPKFQILELFAKDLLVKGKIGTTVQWNWDGI